MRSSYTRPARSLVLGCDATRRAHLDSVRLGRPLVETVESSAIGRGTTALVNNEYTRLCET